MLFFISHRLDHRYNGAAELDLPSPATPCTGCIFDKWPKDGWLTEGPDNNG